MKKIIYFIIASVLLLCGCNKDKEDAYGTIYGIVTDKTTGEPVIAGSVELMVESSVLTRTITGSDGHKEFRDLKPRHYVVRIISAGYRQQTYNLIVEPGRTTNGDILLERQPTYLSVVTNPVSNITATSAVVIIRYSRAYNFFDPRDGSGSNNATHSHTEERPNGIIISQRDNGSTYPTNGGFYYSTDPDPKRGTRVHVTQGLYDPIYSQTLSGLTANTTYYAQGFVTNLLGTEYGNIVRFTTNSQ